MNTREQLIDSIRQQYRIRNHVGNPDELRLTAYDLVLGDTYRTAIELAKIDISFLTISFPNKILSMNYLHWIGYHAFTVNAELCARRLIKIHPGLLNDVTSSTRLTPATLAFCKNEIVCATVFATLGGTFKCVIIRTGSLHEYSVITATVDANDRKTICFIISNTPPTEPIREYIENHEREWRSVLRENNIRAIGSINASDQIPFICPNQRQKWRIGRLLRTAQRGQWSASSCEQEREDIIKGMWPETADLMSEFAAISEFPPEGLPRLCMDLVVEIAGWLIRSN